MDCRMNSRSDEERLFPRTRQYPRRPWTENPQSEPGNSHEEVCAHTPPLARRSTGQKAPQVSDTKSNGAPPSQVHTQTLGRYQRRRNDLNLLCVPLQARIPDSRGNTLGFVFLERKLIPVARGDTLGWKRGGSGLAGAQPV